MGGRKCCFNCAWLEKDSDDRQGGYCIRMPPQMYSGGLPSEYAQFPHVHYMTTRCGEYKPLPRMKKGK